MTKTFEQLQDVIDDAEFPALDLALRRGFHVDRDAAGWYTLLSEAQALLEAFYRRYGCELIHKADGYFYLLPTSDQLPRRQLSSQDMLVGQALALLYLDPISLERGGLVTREQVIEQLVAALGTAALMAAFVPKRKRKDEQAAQRQVRAKIAESIRRLAALGFAEPLAEEQLRLRPALLRFADPVRGLAEPAAALAQLVAKGEVAMVEEELEADASTSDPEFDAEGADDEAADPDDESASAHGSDTDPANTVPTASEPVGTEHDDTGSGDLALIAAEQRHAEHDGADRAEGDRLEFALTAAEQGDAEPPDTLRRDNAEADETNRDHTDLGDTDCEDVGLIAPQPRDAQRDDAGGRDDAERDDNDRDDAEREGAVLTAPQLRDAEHDDAERGDDALIAVGPDDSVDSKELP